MLRLFPSFMRFPILYLLIGVIGLAVVHAAPAPVNLDDPSHSSSLSSPPSPVAETQHLVSRQRERAKVYYDSFIEPAPYILPVILNSEKLRRLNVVPEVQVELGDDQIAERSSTGCFSGRLEVGSVVYSFYASKVVNRPGYWDFDLDVFSSHYRVSGIRVDKSAVAQARQEDAQARHAADQARQAQYAAEQARQAWYAAEQARQAQYAAAAQAERARLANRFKPPPKPPIPQRPRYTLSDQEKQRLRDRQQP
ncbi:hypothetical protein C8R42DRAFT_676463 [Lentinula raphanica]|nr:hypothetical protein C8R42DRAFT_676463 [Lentinula raphanica]